MTELRITCNESRISVHIGRTLLLMLFFAGIETSANSILMPTLVRVPPISVALPDTFTMGSELGGLDQKPVRQVNVEEGFYISEAEVTVAEYRAFVEAEGYRPPIEPSWESIDEHPIVHVSWSDARDYASWLGSIKGVACRLPSEAEWEYSARAGAETMFGVPAPSGGDSLVGTNGALANCADCSKNDSEFPTAPLPVRSFEPNAWGLYDMHGNVAEWVEDCWHPSYAGAPSGTEAWMANCDAMRITRGGSWNGLQSGATSYFRGTIEHFNSKEFYGFRVVCELD